MVYVNVITFVYNNISYNLVSNGIEVTLYYIIKYILNTFVLWDNICCNYSEFSRLEDEPIYLNQKCNMYNTI